MSGETFTCGRRGDAFAAGAGVQGQDTWRDRRDSYHMSPTCSYCGSISPDAFFAAIEAGGEIGPTDKSYKVYVEMPNPRPDALRVVGGSNGADSPGMGDYCKRERDLTDEERQIATACGWGTLREFETSDHWICFGPAGPVAHGKFYFQHLDQAGQDKFIELHNAKAIKIGYPGHFYVMPFFAKPREPA